MGVTKVLSVHEIGRYILARQDPLTEPVTNMKLQKLVYLAQGTTLAMLHRSLWDTTALGARVTAWKQGPVVPDLWREYRTAESRPLPVPTDFDPDSYDGGSRAMVEAVITEYGKLTADQLSKLTHEHDPWVRSRERVRSNPNDDVIAEPELEEFFTRLLAGPKDPRALSPTQLSAAMRAKSEWVQEDARSSAEIAAGKGLSLGELRCFIGQ